MKKITVNGGIRLFGEIEPQGSKNAALPIIFATLITRGVSTVRRVPDIGDVRIALRIIRGLGASVERCGNTLFIDTTELSYTQPDGSLTSAIRASSYLIGACLSRFGEIHISDIGGCNFCNRPIDMHLYAARALGATERGGRLVAEKLRGAELYFEKVSVGATMNALLLSASAEGETVIRGAAREPHVCALIDFLRSAGADITESGSTLTVRGRELAGGDITVIGDMIEAGTYLLLALMTDGKITVKGAARLGLESFFAPLSEGGIKFFYDGDDVTVSGAPDGELAVCTSPYPGYPTDLQPQIAPVMANFFGGRITETVWQNRFSYLNSLSAFGVKSDTTPSFARIYPSFLKSATVTAPDLRGGAAALLCALSARGKSEINFAEIIERGYSDISGKLASLGAEIKICEEN